MLLSVSSAASAANAACRTSASTSPTYACATGAAESGPVTLSVQSASARTLAFSSDAARASVVKPRGYVPHRGDAVWLAFTPHAGHEQAGRRPALVLSPAAYNRKTGLMLACPLTTQIKGYPFEVILRGGRHVTGAVLADQVKSLDWRGREARLIGWAPPAVVNDVLDRIGAILSLSRNVGA